MRRNCRLSYTALLLAVSPTALPAATLTVLGSSGNNQATATFTSTGNGSLMVTLSNTSLAGAMSTSDVLTGFFFSTTAANPITAQSALLAAGATIQNCAACPPDASDVSGQWYWGAAVTGLAASEPSYIFAASPLGFPSNPIGSVPLVAGRSAANVDFGLVPNQTSFGQSALTGSPLVTRQLVFTMNSTVTLDSLTQVGFLWGNAFGGSNFLMATASDAPEPSPWGLLAASLALLVARRRLPTVPRSIRH